MISDLPKRLADGCLLVLFGGALYIMWTTDGLPLIARVMFSAFVGLVAAICWRIAVDNP